MIPTKKEKICFECVNWTENDNKCSCDYEYWVDKEFKEAILYVPYFFDCEEYEYNWGPKIE